MLLWHASQIQCRSRLQLKQVEKPKEKYIPLLSLLSLFCCEAYSKCWTLLLIVFAFHLTNPVMMFFGVLGLELFSFLWLSPCSRSLCDIVSGCRLTPLFRFIHALSHVLCNFPFKRFLILIPKANKSSQNVNSWTKSPLSPLSVSKAISYAMLLGDGYFSSWFVYLSMFGRARRGT